MATRRRPARGRRRALGNTAFINVPYDESYEDLYLAFIAGLSAFGLTPRATLEIPGSQRRLDRIVHLLRRCRYSFHDLSRVELDPTPPPTPRFNIPFERGLAVALEKTQRHRHDWFVFETRGHRVWKSLSDLGGTDEYLHAGSPQGVLRALTNALLRRRRQPTLDELAEVHEDLKQYAVLLKRRFRSASLFEARPFRELVVAARRSASRRVASLRRRPERGRRR